MKSTTKHVQPADGRPADGCGWWSGLTTRQRNICRYAAVSFVALATVEGSICLTLVLAANFALSVRLLLRHVGLPDD